MEVIENIQSSEDVDVPSDTECPICLGDSSQESWRELPCSHRFHKAEETLESFESALEDCLVEWLARKTRCPLCRMDLHWAYHQATQAGLQVGADMAAQVDAV